MTVPTLLRRTSSTSQQLLVLVLPHGLQHGARRNAWLEVVAGTARAADRAQADAAVARAAARGGRPAPRRLAR